MTLIEYAGTSTTPPARYLRGGLVRIGWPASAFGRQTYSRGENWVTDRPVQLSMRTEAAFDASLLRTRIANVPSGRRTAQPRRSGVVPVMA